MDELSTKVKKLNFFQKFRLKNIRKNKNITFKQYLRLPDYIKMDETVKMHLIENNDLKFAEISQIPLTANVSYFKKEQIQKFELREQAKLINNGNIFWGEFSKEEQKNIVYEDIVNQKNYEKMKELKHYDEEEFLDYLREKDLAEKVLPEVLENISYSSKEKILQERPELLKEISEEEQIRFYTDPEHKKYFEYMSPGLQLKYITGEKDNAILEQASIEAKKLFVEQNKNNIQKLSKKEQYQLVGENKELFKYMTKYMQKMIQLANIEKLDLKHLTDIALYSGGMGAIGKLSSPKYMIHGVDGGEKILECDGYSEEKIRKFQKLNSNQIANLIKVDVNYILPYLTSSNDTFSKEEIQASQKRCENVFKELYGNEIFEKYKDSINLIYDMQINKPQIFSRGLGFKICFRDGNENEREQHLKQGEIPLEEFKLLFNEQILKRNTPETIFEYLQEKAQGRSATEMFKNIIQNAYGKKAGEILKSRPSLNVHSINSLEIFEPRILDEYGEAFVHDCISYNLNDFSAFLNVAKDQEKSADFSIYYSALSEIYGKNIETMQKAISEFHCVEELFENARNVDLTDKQYSNLISVICSRRNPNHITNLKELQNYNQIINKQVRKAKNSEELKSVICDQLLGIDYDYNDDYGKDLKFMTSLYDIQSEITRENIYTKNEQKMLQVVNFLAHEKDDTKIKEISEELIKINENGMQIPIDLQSAINKTIEHQTEILNESLTKTDELKRIAKETGNAKDGKVYIENNDGIDYYHLNGVDFSVLKTDIGRHSNEFSVSYEGQGGNGAICCRLTSNKLPESSTFNKNQLFFNIEPNMVIAVSNEDANTQHRPKRVKNRGNINKSISRILELNKNGNEVAINRRFQNHQYITNENHGGRVIPDAYGISSIQDLTEEEIEFCKKYKIPVFVKHEEAYIDKENIPKESQEERQ